jgi:hypothetical protein
MGMIKIVKFPILVQVGVKFRWWNVTLGLEACGG